MKLTILLLLAATLRSATVIPAAPPPQTAARVTQPVSEQPAAAEPDQWRTGAPPARVAATARPVASPPAMARHATDSPDVAPGATAGRSDGLQSISGTASWYSTGGQGVFAAAGPALRHGNWRGSLVTVCTGLRCVTVRLVDVCRCVVGDSVRALDLSAEAFSRLAPLSAGIVRVTVEERP